METFKKNEIMSELKENGIVKIPNFISKKELMLIRKKLILDLKYLKPASKNSTTADIFQQVAKLSQSIEMPKGLDKYTVVLHQILFDLFGRKFIFDEKPQLLLTLSYKVEWTLQGLKWHVDSFSNQLKSLQFFLLIDDVQPCGGGTLVLKGSHQLEKKITLNSLLDSKKLNEVFEIDQNKMSIYELNGTMGDVYLMDMRLLHSPSINVSDKIRMMATYRFYSKDN